MAWKAGAITGEAVLDTKKWTAGSKLLLGSLGAIGAAVGAAAAYMVGAVKASDEWQKSLSNVNTLLDETVVSSQDMAKSLLQLDARLGSTVELTDAMYQAFSAGAEDMDEALEITVQSAKFAKAALTDTSTAVDVITTAMNAYGSEVVSAEQASDIFFTTIKQGKINGEQLAGVIGKSIPLFASLNVPLEELGAGIAAMTKQGVNAAESTTQLNAIMNSFLKPSADMTAALEAQGFASGSALIETEGLQGALTFLEETTGGNKEALSELLPSIEAVRGALALTGTGGEEFASILEEMENASGATQTAFEKQELTFETFRNQMEKTQLVIGNIAKSFVDELAVGATEASESMLDFLMSAEGAEKVANIIAILAGAFHVVKEIVTPLAQVIIPELKDIFDTIVDSINDVVGEGEDAITVFDILSGITQFTASAFKIFSTILQVSITNFGNLISAITEGGKAIDKFFQFLNGHPDVTWDDVKEAAESADEAIDALIVGSVFGTVDILKTVGEEVISFSDNVAESSERMEAAVTTAMDNTRTSVVENWDDLLTGQKDFTEEFETQQQESSDTQADQQETAYRDEEQKLTEHQEKLLSLLSAYVGDQTTAEDLNYDERLEALKQLHDEGILLTEEYNEAVDRLQKERMEGAVSTAMDIADSVLGITGQMLDGIQAAQEAGTDQEISKLDAKYDAQLLALETNHRNEITNDIEFARQKKAIEEKKLEEENELKKKQFESNKSWAIANIWINVATATLGFWASFASMGIAGIVLAGVATAAAIAAGIAETATVNDQTFVPAKQFGGMAGGLTQINEAGGEIVTLPDGSQVIPNDISRQIASESTEIQGAVNNFYITGNSFNNKQEMEAFIKMVKKEIAKDLRSA